MPDKFAVADGKHLTVTFITSGGGGGGRISTGA